MDDIASQLEAFANKLEPLVLKYGHRSLNVPRFAGISPGILIPKEELASELLAIYGEELVGDFFQRGDEHHHHTSFKNYLGRRIDDCSRGAERGKIRLNKSRFVQQLQAFADTLKRGKVPFTVTLRIANVSVRETIAIEPHLFIVPVTPCLPFDPSGLSAEEIEEMKRTAISDPDAEGWNGHFVDIECHLDGKPCDIESYTLGPKLSQLINTTIHPLYLSGFDWMAAPTVVATQVESELGDYESVTSLTEVFECVPIICPEDVEEILYWRSFIEKASSDPTLETALDRAIIGLQRSIYHEHYSTRANWDKLVDYVIALESLLLTVNGSGSPTELSYRFRLNGASILNRMRGDDRETTFKAMKALYELRSSVVHGSGNSMKSAHAFLKIFKETVEQGDVPTVVLRLVCNHVEKWLLDILRYCGSLPREDRPYLRSMGWEKLLWERGSKSAVKGPRN